MGLQFPADFILIHAVTMGNQKMEAQFVDFALIVLANTEIVKFEFTVELGNHVFHTAAPENHFRILFIVGVAMEKQMDR